ncbi:MAG TPA: acetyltransferase [Phycisphaerae bacterium]|nr:acetyltransferase [Phycisphaerae bacterium]
MAVVIYGAGGQARVLLELMERAGICPIGGIVDDDPELHGTKIDGVNVLGPIEKLPSLARVYRIHRAAIAIGDNATRKRFAEHARSIGLRLPVLIHPNAVVSPSAQIGDGTVILAGAVIGPHAKIGELCIVNTHATVDHDCELGDCVHVGPGTTITGGVTIGNGALIGAGATIIPGLIVGDDSIVGAGATVIRDVPSNSTVVGCPARQIPHKPTTTFTVPTPATTHA